jgi:hypothetical protein
MTERLFETAEPDWLPAKYNPIKYVIALASMLMSFLVVNALLRAGNWMAGGAEPDLLDAIQCVAALLCLVTYREKRRTVQQVIGTLCGLEGQLRAQDALARICLEKNAALVIPDTLEVLAYHFIKLSEYRLLLHAEDVISARRTWEYCRSVESWLHRPTNGG